MTSEVFKAVEIHTVAFWVVTLCILVVRYTISDKTPKLNHLLNTFKQEFSGRNVQKLTYCLTANIQNLLKDEDQPLIFRVTFND
jgi:hypothetical protein